MQNCYQLLTAFTGSCLQTSFRTNDLLNMHIKTCKKDCTNAVSLKDTHSRIQVRRSLFAKMVYPWNVADRAKHISRIAIIIPNPRNRSSLLLLPTTITFELNNQRRSRAFGLFSSALIVDNRLVIHISRVIIIHTSSKTTVCKGKLPAGPANTARHLHTYVCKYRSLPFHRALCNALAMYKVCHEEKSEFTLEVNNALVNWTCNVRHAFPLKGIEPSHERWVYKPRSRSYRAGIT